MDTPALRKERGAFFTPAQLGAYVAEWAIRTSSDRILEPSCGEAAFLAPAAARLRALGAPASELALQVEGVEIHGDSAATAAAILERSGSSATIHVGDFFGHAPTADFDALIGNPPYVRYQQHAGEARAKSIEAALAQGVRLNGLASSWAAFVVHASSFLKEDGRLGLVLPAELLTVKYAEEVRQFLLRRFAKIRLVMFEELIFPGVLEEVVLLLAEGSGGAACFEVYQTKNLATLQRVDTAAWAEHSPSGGEKWTPALLGPSLFSAYKGLLDGKRFSSLTDWGSTYLGAVTGANGFFALNTAGVRHQGLAASDVRRISPPGSRHLRGLTFTEAAWRAHLNEGGRGYLFYPEGEPSPAARRYIKDGEQAGVHKSYKTGGRSPWWRVPLVARPDLFLTYMDHDRPRLVTNDAGLDILNSVYGVVLKAGLKKLGRDFLPVACLNSMTLLGAEMVGRAYGGGLLKLEPREADLLPVPSKALIEASKDDLVAIKPQLAGALRSGNLAKAVGLVDKILLENRLRLSGAEIEALRQGRELLFQRRLSRGKGNSGGHKQAT